VLRAALSDEGVDTTMVVRDRIFDGAADLAITKANAAVERGRPLKLHERRDLPSAELARQAGQQPAQGQRRRPTIDEYLERLSERQREEIEQSVWFQGLDERHQADVRRRLAVLERVEAEAEYEFQIWKDEQQLANIDDDVSWRRDVHAVDEDWSALTDAERQAGADVAAAISGPIGDASEYSDDLEDGFVADDYLVEEEV
jgi:hypothetical protein